MVTHLLKDPKFRWVDFIPPTEKYTWKKCFFVQNESESRLLQFDLAKIILYANCIRYYLHKKGVLFCAKCLIFFFCFPIDKSCKTWYNKGKLNTILTKIVNKWLSSHWLLNLKKRLYLAKKKILNYLLIMKLWKKLKDLIILKMPIFQPFS